MMPDGNMAAHKGMMSTGNGSYIGKYTSCLSYYLVLSER